ncbi:AMP-binding protein [Natronococcus wangiae]|uniref:AMP-binding protein n=1 Tax=Natronococcus wangiae TaxID=3068275 RepID=UPI00273FDB36|nr:AMP-binding protein [Natronococcus sp. AD5]
MTLSLARRAERSPDRTAVVDISEGRLYAPAETVHEDRVSYGGLSRIVAQTAGALAERGVESGDTVCLVTRNRVASIALLFACRRLGATLAPISHRLTPTTVKRPFDALEPTLVVAEAAQRDLVRSIPFDRTVTLEQLADADASTVDTAERPSDADAPLLALHGTPGQPVVAFAPSTVEWNCISAIVAWGLSRDDSGIVLDPLSAPDGLFRTALPLLYVGGRLLLDRAFDPGDALTAIDHHVVTVLGGRAAPVRELAADENAGALARVERAICDQTVEEGATETLLEHGVSVSRAYGLLECPTAMSRTVSGPTEGDAVGRPVLDCRARLVDDGTVLEGAADGTLQLSGPVVADGYVNPADTGDAGGSREAKQEPESDAETRQGRGENGDGDEGSAAGSGDGSDGGEFTNGWFDTGDRFRRDEDGVYYRS